MATPLNFLTTKEIKEYDTPPFFSNDDRNRFFKNFKWMQQYTDTLNSPINKVGFVLQVGYFKATNRFFAIKDFHKKDIEFVYKQLKEPYRIANFSYKYSSYQRHQDHILDYLGYRKFEKDVKKSIAKEAFSLTSKQMKPKLVFLSLVQYLQSKKIELPSFRTLAFILSAAIKDLENQLFKTLEVQLTDSQRSLLDTLLTPQKTDKLIRNQYRITSLKKSNQSQQASKVRENVQDLIELSDLYFKMENLITSLNMSSEMISYYAQVVIKSKVNQIAKRNEHRYLYLIAFVVHQFYKLNDVLIDILLQAVQSAFNSSRKTYVEQITKNSKNRSKRVAALSKKMKKKLNTLTKIKGAARAKFSDKELGKIVRSLLKDELHINEVQMMSDINAMILDNDEIQRELLYFSLLEDKSRKVQNRVSDTIKNIVFDFDTSNLALIDALKYYKDKDGILSTNVPQDFFDAEIKKLLVKKDKTLNTKLYKILFFDALRDAIKSGQLNLVYSYKYRSFEDYLISNPIWSKNKTDILLSTGLDKVSDYKGFKDEVKKAVRHQFDLTNKNYLQGKNKYITPLKGGTLRIDNPTTQVETIYDLSDLFPKNRFVPLFEILHSVNIATKFSDSFEDFRQKHHHEKPQNSIYYAGIIGLGCNHGIPKIAKISKDINLNTLENTVNWQFTVENLIKANDTVVKFMNELDLPKIYQSNENVVHTSSDGQKFNIGVESLNANYSFKYFGKDKGVSVFSFIDNSHKLFYSTVISASEREASYVIDGLMHNEVIQSDIHSTDTHGFNEVVFGVCHLLGISFAPRIKNVSKQTLYAFDPPSFYKKKKYLITPVKQINSKLIEDNWDNILRFVATIKTKETTASQLFLRLNSYSKQHPLYKSLKEFGRIFKTIFILKFYDDVKLRQSVDKQLNKGESANKLGKAIKYARNQEFLEETKEDQIRVESCKRLIANSIICWNYMHLTNVLLKEESDTKRREMLDVIKNGSVVSWEHINLQGEFNFSEELLKESTQFNLKELLDLKIA
jgi:TnpA family transposase